MRSVLAIALLAGCSFTPPQVAGAPGDGPVDPADARGDDVITPDAPVVLDAPPPPPDAGPPDAPPPPDAIVCPGGYSAAPPAIGGCYRYVASERTWEDARDDCASVPGAHLVSIGSAEENAHVLSLLVGNTIYFGISDRGTEGTYTWVSGEPVVYTNWLSGEGTSGSEDCGEMNATSGGWYDDQCDNDRPYVCEH